MKICKFCGAENVDSAFVCSSCGGNAFSNKCDNCGTVFDEGNYCPKCGVKVGTKAKKCPRCYTEYYSAACPNCGYTGNYAYNSISINGVYTKEPVQKRRTWLWVLGWIFIFPVPLTILILRNQKLNQRLKIVIIAAAWIFFLLLAWSGNESNESLDTVNSTANISPTVVLASSQIL